MQEGLRYVAASPNLPAHQKHLMWSWIGPLSLISPLCMMVCVPHTANWRRVGPEHRTHRIRGLSSNHPDAAGHLSAALPWCCAQSTVKQIFLCRLSGVARVLLVHVDPPRDYISHRHTHTPHCTVVDVIFPA